MKDKDKNIDKFIKDCFKKYDELFKSGKMNDDYVIKQDLNELDTWNELNKVKL